MLDHTFDGFYLLSECVVGYPVDSVLHIWTTESQDNAFLRGAETESKMPYDEETGGANWGREEASCRGRDNGGEDRGTMGVQWRETDGGGDVWEPNQDTSVGECHHQTQYLICWPKNWLKRNYSPSEKLGVVCHCELSHRFPCRSQVICLSNMHILWTLPWSFRGPIGFQHDHCGVAVSLSPPQIQTNQTETIKCFLYMSRWRIF